MIQRIKFAVRRGVMKNKVIHIFIGSFLASLLWLPRPVEATVFDLSLVSSPDVTVNGAIFSRTSNSGQGTGNFESFLRTQATGNETTQKGYNTDGTLEFQTKGGPWTHSVLLSDIPLVTIDGISYRELLLDAAEPSGNRIDITALKLYRLSTPNVSGYPANFPSGDLMYNLDLGTDNSIKLDNVTGNGVSDLFAYIPNSNFTGSKPYLYLYTEFAFFAGSFEEWGYLKSDGTVPDDPAIPEPTSLALLGTGILGFFVRRFKK